MHFGCKERIFTPSHFDKRQNLKMLPEIKSDRFLVLFCESKCLDHSRKKQIKKMNGKKKCRFSEKKPGVPLEGLEVSPYHTGWSEQGTAARPLWATLGHFYGMVFPWSFLLPRTKSRKSRKIDETFIYQNNVGMLKEWGRELLSVYPHL